MPFKQWIQSSGGDTASYVLFFSTLAFSLLAERLASRKRQAGRVKRWLTNYGFLPAGVLFSAITPALPLTVAFWAERHHVGLLNQVSLPLSAMFALTVLLRSLAFWVIHFLSHKVPLFWRVHRVHHMDTEVDVSTATRVHVVEGLLGGLLVLPFVAIFGLAPWALMAYEFVLPTIGLLIHANIRLPESIDRVLRLFVQTPSLHRVHHSVVVAETDSNYGDMFAFWDVLFGTHRTRPYPELATMPLGLAEVRDARERSFLWLMLSPFLRLTPERVDKASVRPHGPGAGACGLDPPS